MCSRDVIFRFAGSFILLSGVLAWHVHPAWLLFTAFVGFNLVQSSITHFCPLERMIGAARLLGCLPANAPAQGSGS